MKKTLYLLLISLVILSTSFIIFGQLSYADSGTDNMVFKSCDELHASGNPFCKNVQANQSGFELVGRDGIITKVGQVIVWLVGIVSVIMVAVGGFKYTISGGDSSGVQSAKNTIIYSLVGLAVALFAQIIVSFVIGKL